ncbi:MAG: hypothetical protein AABX98_01170 [Nanoarchaeota archaeon]
MLTTIEYKAVVITFGLRSLDVLVSSLNQNHIHTVSFSDSEELYLGGPDGQGLAVQRYPLILASLYGSRYIRGEVPVPEGISFAELLREQDGPNKETPLFLFYTADLTPALEQAVSRFERRKPSFPTLVPENTILLFNLEDKEDWEGLHELTAYIVSHTE